MERFVCIHAHFYQPPRENPWLEAVEQQDSAYPFHDWNQRITEECYAPNAAARMVDTEGRIVEIVNNYSRISFNFGPTLLSWLDEHEPETYAAILEADRQSQKLFSGHGSAIAQVYNHMILPLAHRRDRETQVLWGLRDFQSRFRRDPEGMWLAETAVDLDSLDILAANGIRFTILSPYQAAKARMPGARNFRDVSGGRIDPTRAYSVRLPSNRHIAVFFYDGPISRAVAFEQLLNRGEDFANRILSGFSDQRDWPQLMHIATDGESYGHHHPHGDMALAYALKYIEEHGDARLTNYGEYLSRHPAAADAQIVANSSWSCSHGVERWKSDCGCNSGGHADWNQAWRGPLRLSLDWLRDEVAPYFEREGGRLLRDPWRARDDYIRVVLDRSPANLDDFFGRHAARDLTPLEQVRALMLLELQRHAMLMFTSCGWFFDEISGIETVKVLEYAARVVQLAQMLFAHEATGLEEGFLARLSEARSNLPAMGDAAQIYRRQVAPLKVTLREVGAHYAITSLFERSGANGTLYCYEVESEDFQRRDAGRSRLGIGRARIISRITREEDVFTFGVLHFGDHNVNAAVRAFQGMEAYQQTAEACFNAFGLADFPEVIRILDRSFDGAIYSLQSLFRDERNSLLQHLLASTLREAEAAYRNLYENHAPLLRFLSNSGMEQPRILALTAEFVLNAMLREALSLPELDANRIRDLLRQAGEEGIALDTVGLGYALERNLERLIEEFREDFKNIDLLRNLVTAAEIAVTAGLPVNLWHAQNLYYQMARSLAPGSGDEWLDLFIRLGEHLRVYIHALQLRLQPTA